MLCGFLPYCKRGSYLAHRTVREVSGGVLHQACELASCIKKKKSSNTLYFGKSY